QWWRCSSDKNYIAFIVSNLDKKNSSKGIHNHPTDCPNKIEKQSYSKLENHRLSVTVTLNPLVKQYMINEGNVFLYFQHH
ncbi:FLYWCH-type domain-containing protein, partial [Aphis craccivora]